MSAWMHIKIQKIKEQEENRQQQERLQLHKADLIKQRAPMLWNLLADLIAEDVALYNETFGGEPGKVITRERPTENRLLVQNSTFPNARFDARFNGTLVNVDYQLTPAQFGNTREETLVLEFDIDQQDNIRFKYRDSPKVADEVVGILLDPLLPKTNGD